MRPILGVLFTPVGARVSIHDPRNMPHPEIVGFNAPPGRETSVAVRAMHIQRLEPPYTSKCTSTFPPVYLSFTTPHVDYSMFECSIACQRYHIQHKCKCLVEWKIRLHSDVPSNEYIWCGIAQLIQPGYYTNSEMTQMRKIIFCT